MKGRNTRTFAHPEIGLTVSAEYYYRRQLGAKDLLPAVGVGVAAGMAAFYIVQLLIQRTPLVPQGELPHSATPPTRMLADRAEPETETHYARELPPGQPPGARALKG